MTSQRLRRLRGALTLVWALLSLLAIGGLAVVAIVAVDDLEREQLDRHIEARALQGHDWAYPDDEKKNVLFVETVTPESPFSASAVAAARGEAADLAVIDERG